MKSTWSCLPAGVCAGSTRRLPDMPRCTISQPRSQSRSRYLPRRSTARTTRPTTRVARFLGTGQRNRRSRTTTSTMRLPIRQAASPRRVVSTSGSSGMTLFLVSGLAGDQPRVEQAPARFLAQLVDDILVHAQQLQVRLAREYLERDGLAVAQSHAHALLAVPALE